MNPMSKQMNACARKRGWIHSVLSSGIQLIRRNTLRYCVLPGLTSRFFTILLCCFPLLLAPAHSATAAAPGSIFKVTAFADTGSHYWWWPIDPSLPPGYYATYSAVSADGQVPSSIVAKATEWATYWAQQSIAYAESQPNIISSTIVSGPTCVPGQPAGWWSTGITCATRFETSYYGDPGRTIYTSYYSDVYSVPYSIFSPCPAGTEFVGPNPGDCRMMCPEGQTRDPVTGVCERKCPVAELTELKDLNDQLSNNDPDTMTLENNPINTARLTPETKNALTCLEDKVKTYKIPFNLTSAFRTEAYQSHLWEIWDRWKTKGLSTNADPGCQARKAKVKAEWDHHGLEGLLTSPADDAGKHPQGMALDISRKTTMKQLINAGVNIQELAKECNLSYPFPILDKGHFESK